MTWLPAQSPIRPVRKAQAATSTRLRTPNSQLSADVRLSGTHSRLSEHAEAHGQRAPPG
jgi:hypothetical protein